MKFTAQLVARLAARLDACLTEFYLHEAYSAGREELVLHFKKQEEDFVMRMLWEARTCFLLFSNEPPVKPVPHFGIFDELRGRRVLTVAAHTNNRSFEIALDGQFALVFKMYDGLSNVLLYRDTRQLAHFRSGITSDAQLTRDDFSRAKAYDAVADSAGPDAGGDILVALTRYAKTALAAHRFEARKRALLAGVDAQLKRLQQVIVKAGSALEGMRNGISAEHKGHLLMSNLPLLKGGEESISVFDYLSNKEVTIELKDDLDGPANAAYYFRKAKKQKQEEMRLVNSMQEAERRTTELQDRRSRIDNAQSSSDLRFFEKEKSKEKEPGPFREFSIEGFTIWVGRNATNNDLLTMKYAHKNDLWLHARGVGGSHVVIKQQGGKPFPKKVTEFAASLAAAYSTAKGSALVPVAYTERKFVRKPKGAAVGAVVLDKEEVIYVKPFSK